MARVHFVKKARKAIKSIGVKPGDSYYWWKNRMPGARAENLEQWASDLEGVDLYFDEEGEEKFDEWLEGVIDEIRGFDPGV